MSAPVRVNDLIDAAFDELEVECDILAKQDFSCCQSCGSKELGDQQIAEGRKGYVFYHCQGTESAEAGHGLYLAYSDVAAGKIVVKILRKHGVPTQWNGSMSKCIHIKPFKWSKPKQWGSVRLIPGEVAEGEISKFYNPRTGLWYDEDGELVPQEIDEDAPPHVDETHSSDNSDAEAE